MSTPLMLVVGGSRGIGAATARLAAARGFDVALTYKSSATDAAAVAADIAQCGRKALTIKADAQLEADALRTFREVRANWAWSPDALVYNSALSGPESRLDEANANDMRSVLDTNIFGALLHARAAVQGMSTRHGGAGGSIVFVGSRAAALGSPSRYVWYAASKGALLSLATGLALEVGQEGIRVNVVSPGPILSNAGAVSRAEANAQTTALKRVGRPEEVAAAILFISSGEASFITGSELRVDGGR